MAQKKLTNIRMRDGNYRDELIDVNADMFCSLGPNSRFYNCEFRISTRSAQLLILEATFEACKFRIDKALKNVPWTSSKLIYCKFNGRLSGSDFGRRLDQDESDALGLVQDCDFSEAMLDGCRFFNCRLESLKLPKWPCYVLFDQTAAAKDLITSAFTPSARRYGEVLLEVLAQGETALCLLAKQEARALGCSEEQLRAFLEGKPYVLM